MDEKDFKDLMQQSKLEVQFPDFEEQVMEKIKVNEATRRSVWRNIKLSWMFFIIGTFFGIFVTQFLSDMELPFVEGNSKLIFLLAEILIVFVVVSQFDSLLRFTFKKRE